MMWSSSPSKPKRRTDEVIYFLCISIIILNSVTFICCPTKALAEHAVGLVKHNSLCLLTCTLHQPLKINRASNIIETYALTRLFTSKRFSRYFPPLVSHFVHLCRFFLLPVSKNTLGNSECHVRTNSTSLSMLNLWPPKASFCVQICGSSKA